MKYKKSVLLSVWWLFVLIIAGTAIALAVWVFYSADVDVKRAESDVLNEKIMNCISLGGHLNEDFFNEDFNVFEECFLDENMFVKNSNFYFNVSIYGGDGLVRSIAKGSHTFEKDCVIEKEINAEYFPKCVINEEKVRGSDGEYRVIILSGSNQNGERYKLDEN